MDAILCRRYVDVLINNAGTMPKADGPKDLTFDAISSTIATNAVSAPGSFDYLCLTDGHCVACLFRSAP